MLFNSIAFAVFLPVVFALYWMLPHKTRWMLILAASYYFYMSWNAKYVFLILFTTIISYGAAILLEKTGSLRNKKCILAATSLACLGVLFFFKYFNFVSESVTAAFRLFAIQMDPVLLNLLLPVGISFYTFQTLGYVIDVYRGDVKAEHHFGYYAAFISFFPQLVAGPIERTSNLLPQIKAKYRFDYDQATYGLKLMAWGYFKKIVIADTLSQYVSKVYDAPQRYSGFALILATVFFTLQIYCDFSGYSDIAIGTAKLLGINLMKNFKSPYFSQSIKEFWSRWHISLSTWFRDYVYIPLGGSRVGKIRHTINLLITFLVSGLWHGANWTFVIWGGIHGVGQAIENTIGNTIGRTAENTIENSIGNATDNTIGRATAPKDMPKEKSKGAVSFIRVFVTTQYRKLRNRNFRAYKVYSAGNGRFGMRSIAHFHVTAQGTEQLRVFLVFAFASFAWVFFVSNSLADAGHVIMHAFDGIVSPFSYLKQGFKDVKLEMMDLFYLAVSLLMLTVYDHASLKYDVIREVSSLKAIWRWLIYIALIMWILLNFPVSNKAEFIYFQF